MPNLFLKIFILGIIFPFVVSAQQNRFNAIHSFSKEEIANVLPIVLADLDAEKLKKEDAERAFDIRFAAPIACNINLDNDGTWYETTEKRIWFCKIKVAKAEGLAFAFKDFYLPEGATLHFFSPNKKIVSATIDAQSNNNEEVFLSETFLTNEVCLQYEEPIATKQKGSFSIFNTYFVYKKYHLQSLQNQSVNIEDRDGDDRAFGFGTALDCHVNINCPMVDTVVKDIKRGIVRITMVLKEGMGYCTGTLVNNTARDGRPLILTAFHCQDGYTPYYNLWKFDFHYESKDCNNPTTEPVVKSITGCTRKSGWVATDFLLLELTSPISNEYNTFYNGWNRSDAIPQGKTYLVHHPSGDIKKYSESSYLTFIENSAIEWNNQVTTPASHHFRHRLSIGMIEIGSSGCGFFNKEKQLIGNFNGGNFDLCTSNNLYYGRLNKSWEGGGTPTTRLKDWFDPLNTGAVEMNGQVIDNKIVRGKFDDPFLKGTIFKMVVTAVDSFNKEITKDTLTISKNYSFLLKPRAKSYSLQPFKLGNAGEFVSTADIVLMSKHILGVQALPNAWQLIAADINKSGTVSTADIVEVRKVILGLKDKFDNNNPWVFRILNDNITNKTTLNGGIQFSTPFQSNNIIDFEGIKIGDVNGNGY